jgi:hypothetical protein
MAFSDNKITVADLTGKGVTGMADTPNLTTAQMQQKLDEIAKEVIPPKFNALCDDLDATDFASIITSKSTDKMLFQRLNEYDQIEYSVDNVNWYLIASGKEVLDPTLEADNAKNAYKLGGQFPAYYQKTTDSALNTTSKLTTGAINEIKTGLDNVDTTANEAPTYNATLTYAVGDYVSYQKHIYKCNTAIEVAEEWNASHWTQVTLGAEIETVNNSLITISNDLNDLINNLINANPLIPVMTSNTAPSGTASATSETNGLAFKALDGNNITAWMSDKGVICSLQYVFTKDVNISKIKYLVIEADKAGTYIGQDATLTFAIYNGTTWIDVTTDTLNATKATTEQTLSFSNVLCRGIRMTPSAGMVDRANGFKYCQMASLQIYGIQRFV